ncbi:hypothetical protein [Thiolapillus sp.]
METGRVYRFPVTDGKHLYHYTVKVQKQHSIEMMDGSRRKAWKLRFDAVEGGAGAGAPSVVCLAGR